MDSVRTRAASPAAADVLPVVAARATLAAGWGRDWSDVRAEVDRLADREDLPEAKLLASLLSIREEHRGQRAGEWSHARLDGVKSGLPGTAATDVVLAECWYNYARSAPGPSEECWQSCLRACDRYLDTPGRETGLAFSDALLLRALARLMLDEGPVAERPAAGLLAGHRPWLEAVNLVGHFVRKPWQPGQGSGGGPTLAGPRPTVLRPEDVALIRFAAGLAAGDQGVGQYWPAVQGMADETFFALPLLQARYARLSGDQSRAVEEYNRALAAAAKGKRYRLFELIAEEQP
jgi:hypothetical protein